MHVNKDMHIKIYFVEKNVSLLASHGAKGSHDIQGEHECL